MKRTAHVFRIGASLLIIAALSVPMAGAIAQSASTQSYMDGILKGTPAQRAREEHAMKAAMGGQTTQAADDKPKRRHHTGGMTGSPQ
jgi:hypothetical protein